MKARLMTMDLAVLGIVVAVVILFLLDRGIWFDRCVGAGLVLGGIWFFVPGTAALLRLRQSSIIPYPVLGTYLIIQGIALGIFHVRF